MAIELRQRYTTPIAICTLKKKSRDASEAKVLIGLNGAQYWDPNQTATHDQSLTEYNSNLPEIAYNSWSCRSNTKDANRASQVFRSRLYQLARQTS